MAIVEIDNSELVTFLKLNLGEKLPESFDTRRLVTNIADFAAGYMKTRTLRGVDRDLAPFVAYAPSTVKYRQKKGRQTAHVDLFFSGHMHAGIGARTVSDTEAVVGFFSAAESRKAIAHQMGLKKMPQRRFFGLGEDDSFAMSQIQKIHEQELDSAIKEAT